MAASDILSHCVGPLSRESLSRLPHHVMPCMNLRRVFPNNLVGDDMSALLSKPFPYASSVPRPLPSWTAVSREVLNGLDPTTSLIREKIKWQMKKEKLVQAVRRDRKQIGRKVINKAYDTPAGGKVTINRGVVLLAQHLDQDPDPKFSGVSNWYYTGGTVSSLQQGADLYLVYATNARINWSRIERDQWDVGGLSDLEHNEPVHQITSNSKGLAVRQKSCITIHAPGDGTSEAPSLDVLHSVTTKKRPFVSVALPDDSLREYCTLTTGGVLKHWHVECTTGHQAKVHISPAEGVTVSDHWAKLLYLDPNTLLLANRCCLHLLDIRAGMKELQLAWCVRGLTEQCEEVCQCVCSSHAKQVYVATTHQALLLDTRLGFTHRWTHLLSAPPHLATTHPLPHNEELLCLGSQILSDCVAIVNSWQGDEAEPLYSPGCLQAPARGLELARFQGLCLEPRLTQRCTQSMTGLTLVPVEGGVGVVRQSATADVFMQRLTRSDQLSDQLTEMDLTAYSDWSQHCQVVPSPVDVTELVDLKPLLEVLKEETPAVETTRLEDDEFEVGTSWRLSKQYLEDCVDLLAPRLLSVWGLEGEDEWAEGDKTFVEEDPAEKVRNWLGQGAFDPPSGVLEHRNVTDLQSQRPVVTSTPFLPAPEAEASPESPEAAWAAQPEYHTPRHKQTTLPVPFTTLTHSSAGSATHSRKKLRMFDDSVTTPLKPTPVKKQQKSAKKFVPGF